MHECATFCDPILIHDARGWQMDWLPPETARTLPLLHVPRFCQVLKQSHVSEYGTRAGQHVQPMSAGHCAPYGCVRVL